ncbi:hypothetical protein CY0110_15547 [Crocosphaera chwakensis CCY0110]|uniref:Uncharacterized protein n=1 Tax=Crocosphaera chwakensis CCY0110 TaxID=391612 RepID=A3IHE1_9CHRO|nr:hypothetical protein CY0110_15547 [Crocosphaera chwakensis CCY0110]
MGILSVSLLKVRLTLGLNKYIYLFGNL